MRFVKTGLLAAMATVLMFSVALPQSSSNKTNKAFGLRAGYGTNPDQFVFGPQAVLGRTLGFMRFAPSIDIGMGDNMSTYLFNADFRVLSFSPPESPAGIYAGAGPSIAIFDLNDGGSDTEIGLNVVAGLTFPMGRKNDYNLEVRFGFADMPDLKILLGIMLGGRAR